MRTENALRWVALGCAFLLLLAPLGERTYWERGNQNWFNRVYDNTPYDFLALLSGVIALAGLYWTVFCWPRRSSLAIGAAATMAAFALTAVAFGFYWAEAAQGIFRIGGEVYVADNWTVHPMTGYQHFAVVSVVGAAVTLALAVRWLARPKDM